MTSPVRVHVIIACHNRRALTLRSLKDLYKEIPSPERLTITLYDDGSSDGTAEAVREEFPAVDIMQGDGSAYWAKSMSRAEQQVLGSQHTSDDDYLLWMNDDVSLLDGSLGRLLAITSEDRNAVVVGAMQDPVTGETTYSGFVRSGIHPLRYRRVDPSERVALIDAFNGNLVLVPVRVARSLGGIDGEFSHAWADVDYGYRCGSANVPALLAPGFAGVCSSNQPPDHENLRLAWKRFIGPKGGGNFSSLKRILRRHGGSTWPFFIAVTYGMWWLRALRGRVSSRLPSQPRHRRCEVSPEGAREQ